MPQKPRNRGTVQRLIGNLQEYLGNVPFHLQTALVKDGFPSLLGLAAGLWEKVRTVQVAAVPEAPPAPAAQGIPLYEFPQARFHFVYGAGAVGGEQASITVWHRSRDYDDPNTLGHWTRGQVYASVDDLEEVLDPCHWHSEIYLQVTAVAPGACAELTLFVQGVQDMNAGADVNVVVPPVTVAISAYSTPPSSVLAAGTEDGLPGGAKHIVRLWPNGTSVKDVDDWDDDVAVSLVGARAAPGTEITDLLGHSLSGRSLTVMSCNGTAVIKLDRPSTTLTALAAAQYGTIAIDTVANRFTRTVGTWASDVGGTKANGYPLNYAAPGTRITIAGSDHNNGTYTVTSITGGGTELNVAEALVGPDEPASALIAVTGYRPKTGKTITALMWPATVEIEQEFTKVYVENAAQLGCSMVLAVGDRV